MVLGLIIVQTTSNINTISVASQAYKTSSNEEYIIIGNDALMKCLIPSFVADFVSVINWEDSEGNLIFANNNFGNDRPESVALRVKEGTSNLKTCFCLLQNIHLTLGVTFARQVITN